MRTVIALLFVGVICVPLSGVSPDALARYRDVTLGESLDTVLERLDVVPANVKVLYDAPSLIQELTWRPNRFVSGSTLTPDPVAEVVLTFHLGRLARVVVLYDRERTVGLTNADLHELLSDVYGVALLPSTSHVVEKVTGSTLSRVTIGSWANDDTSIALWREEYPGRLGLTITSTSADRALQEASTDGALLEAKNAPQRDRDQKEAAAATAKDRDARIRLENKAKFKP